VKYLLVIFINFSIAINYAQEADSISIQKIEKDKLYQIERWEKQIVDARKRSDLYTEMIVLMELIYFKTNDFADNISTYEDLRYLEKLVANNPNQRAIKRIEAPMNLFLGFNLRDQNKLEEALPYFDRAVLIAKEQNQKEFYKDASSLRAELLNLMGKRDEALSHFRRLEKEAKATNDSIFKNRLYETISGFYLYEEQIDSSLFYAKKSIDNFSPTNQRAFRNIRVAECFLKLERDIDSAVFYAEIGLKLAKEAVLLKEQMMAHDYLADAYGRLEKYDKAYYHFKRFYDFEQEHRSFDNALQIGNFNTQQEIERSQLQQTLADERLSNQRIIIWAVSGGLLLLIIGLYYIFNRLKIIRKQNKIIEQEKLRAEQSERHKEQFLANMSHEIRTPMNAISGMINAITRRNHPKYQDVYLNAMKISLDNLLVIINDVLDLSKIESGNLEISYVNMDCHEVIEHVTSILKYKAEEKAIVLKSTIQDNFPKVIIGDPVRLNQILMNLVGNAIKFTDSGFVEIKLSRDNDKIKVSVTDSGIGISQNQLDTIFDSFKQGSNISKSRYGGTGLGLTITKQLIELQNGRIWAESEEGVGSTFYFELPLIVSEDAQEVQSTFTETQLITLGKELKGLKILIAEDNEFNIMVVKDDLNWYIPEVNITVVENGKLAVETFSKENFDVILMDVQMPEMNGYQATKAIRSMEEETRIPIIAMTASLLKNQIDKCYNAGMNGYIPKPYKPEELIKTLHDNIKKNQ